MIAEWIAYALEMKVETLQSLMDDLNFVFVTVIPLFVIGSLVFWQYFRNYFLDHIELRVNYMFADPDHTGRFLFCPRGAGMQSVDDALPANRMFRTQLHRAIRRCRTNKRFVRMRTASDRYALKSYMQKVVSAVYADTWISGDLTKQPDEKPRLIALTFEVDHGTRCRMMRLIITSKRQLDHIRGLVDQYPDLLDRTTYQHPHHRAGLQSLIEMAELYYTELAGTPPENRTLWEVRVPADANI